MQNLFEAFWKNNRAKLGFSIFCLLVAIFDTFFKALSPIAAGALSIAIVPWVISFIEKVSAPGGFEIVFAKAERQIDAAKTEPDQEDINAFKYIEGSAPNLAIALLRVQIERRLREIAEDVQIESSPRGRPRTLRALAEALAREGAISNEAVNLINDLNPVMNEAVHGGQLQPNASNFALEYGPKILSMLKPQGAS